MTTSRTTVSVSRRTALAGLGAAALGLDWAVCGLNAFAQEVAPFPMDGHPTIGSWRWTNQPDTPREDISFAIFSGDGGYVEAGLGRFVAVGVWRATGERTAELVLNPGGAIPLDAVFEPGYVIAEACLVRRDAAFLRVMMELDETGNRMTATGIMEHPDGSDGIAEANPYAGWADRMTIALDMAATPTS
jgi:hypothetical protein